MCPINQFSNARKIVVYRIVEISLGFIKRRMDDMRHYVQDCVHHIDFSF